MLQKQCGIIPTSSCPFKILSENHAKAATLWKEAMQFMADLSLPHTTYLECLFSLSWEIEQDEDIECL